MLTLTVPRAEFFDDEAQEFITLDAVTLNLEHSLVSLSRWESKWEKPFLASTGKTTEETFGYVEAMSLDGEIPPEVFSRLSNSHLEEINRYINAKMTATWFAESRPNERSSEIITSELIYYWIAVFNIPLACEDWHLNRLFTLIKVVNEKNKPQKKMSQRELAARNRQLNEQRLREMNTSG